MVMVVSAIFAVVIWKYFPRNIADCQVQDISAQTYTGSVITPDVTVTYGNKTLTQE